MSIFCQLNTLAMLNITGNTIQVSIENYFEDENVAEEVYDFIAETKEYLAMEIHHHGNSVVMFFTYSEDASLVAVATKLRFGELEVWLLP